MAPLSPPPHITLSPSSIESARINSPAPSLPVCGVPPLIGDLLHLTLLLLARAFLTPLFPIWNHRRITPGSPVTFLAAAPMHPLLASILCLPHRPPRATSWALFSSILLRESDLTWWLGSWVFLSSTDGFAVTQSCVLIPLLWAFPYGSQLHILSTVPNLQVHLPLSPFFLLCLLAQ